MLCTAQMIKKQHKYLKKLPAHNTSTYAGERTDGRTDSHDGDYMLPRKFSGSIKTRNICYVTL